MVLVGEGGIVMLQQMIDYYKEQEQLCIRNMNKFSSEYWAQQGIKYSKLVDTLNAIKADGVFND